MGIFNRMTDPRTVEELMVAEYQDLKVKLNDTKDQMRIAVSSALDHTAKLERTIEEKDNEIAVLEHRIEEVEQQSSGVIDLHEEVTLYKMGVWGDYYFKNYFGNFEGPAERLEALREIQACSDQDILDALAPYNTSYHGRIVSIKQLTNVRTLSVPLKDTRVKRYYAIDNDSRQLIKPITDVVEGEWTVASKEECKVEAIKLLRARIKYAIKGLEDRLKSEKNND